MTSETKGLEAPAVAVSPREAADDVLKRAQTLLALENQVPAATASVAQEDLRRMSLALGLASLDTYLHWAVRGVSLDSPPKELRNVKVSFGDLVSMGEASVQARIKQKKDRPKTRARNVLNKVLLRMTFQSSQEVERALQMLGVQECWTRVSARVVGQPKPEEIKQRLDKIARRRNLIVHEGDLKRLVRPQEVRHQVLTRAEVSDDLDWLGQFIDALDAVLVTR